MSIRRVAPACFYKEPKNMNEEFVQALNDFSEWLDEYVEQLKTKKQ